MFFLSFFFPLLFPSVCLRPCLSQETRRTLTEHCTTKPWCCTTDQHRTTNGGVWCSFSLPFFFFFSFFPSVCVRPCLSQETTTTLTQHCTTKSWCFATDQHRTTNSSVDALSFFFFFFFLPICLSQSLSASRNNDNIKTILYDKTLVLHY